MPDIPGDQSTTATIAVGGTATGDLEAVGDRDWFAVTLTAGQAVTILVNGITLDDPYLYIRDSAGVLLFENDDISVGVNLDSRFAFNPNYSGTYYIDVGAFDDDGMGTYQVSVQPYVLPPVATVDQIAAQLVSGYWEGDSHRFNVTQGGTLTVNISVLTPTEQSLARAALAAWSDIIGVNFQEVTGAAQITFDNSEDPDGPIAATEPVWANGIMSSAFIQISSSWLTNFGSTLNSYGFETYVHEVGHALGLGHAGNYNFEARYPYDALFQNDATPLSVMSYFDQEQNTYFNFSRGGFDVTPMAADILAMQSLYGLSTTTRTGDTVYGYNSNAGDRYNASLYTNVAYTIFDNGGRDTLNFSGSAFNQQINLNAETFSQVVGGDNNLYIARGIVIENAIGGAGDDTIVQNAADNVLNGGPGQDRVSYDTATAAVTVNMSFTAQQDTIGAGRDTLNNFEELTGSRFNDTLTGSAFTVWVRGGDGNDTIISSSVAGEVRQQGFEGNAGDDLFIPGPGNDRFFGGDGFDTVDYSGASGPIRQPGFNNQTGSGIDDLIAVERLIGSAFNDNLSTLVAGELFGGAGDDFLESWGVSKLYGGTGDDSYLLRGAGAEIFENAGEGTEWIQAQVSYALGANLENLLLLGSGSLNGTGNSGANIVIGNPNDNILSGLAGADTLTGGAGSDRFQDSAAGLNGDTITDFGSGDRIVITDANLAGFTFSLTGNVLTYTGGSLTLQSVPTGTIVVQAASGGGVQLSLLPHDVRDDFNGDRFGDLLFRDSNNSFLLGWLGQSNGGFAGNGILATGFEFPPDWRIAAMGDYNGDGREDVLLRSDAGWLTNWLGNVNGRFDNNGTNTSLFFAPEWKVAGEGDFNGDGKADLLLRRDDGWLTNWLGTSTGSFSNNGANTSLFFTTDWKIASTGDFNGDGYTDILLRRDDGWVTNWLGTANGGFTNNGANTALFFTLDWKIVGTGDVNGDGRDDLILRREDGWITDWLAAANGGFTNNGANTALFLSTDWTISSIGDFNGDSREDILLRHSSGWLTDWLGTATGSFANNGANFSQGLATNWVVQDPFM